MFSWLKGKVTGDSSTGAQRALAEEATSFGAFSKDDDELPSSNKNTLVVVREGAVRKMTLESNELQLLNDIPEFKPFLQEGTEINSLNTVDARALLNLCKILQDYMARCSESVSVEQLQLTNKMKETDQQVKAIMERLSERQRSYARCAEHLSRTSDMTQQIRRLRQNVKETEAMLNALNDNLPESVRLPQFSISGQMSTARAESTASQPS